MRPEYENEIVGTLKMSWHAMNRWKERVNGDLLESIWKAVPYGGQKGGSMFLRNGDTVFVINVHKVIVTVLTREMAIANMQMVSAMGPRESPESIVPAKKPSPKKVAKESKEGAFACLLFDKTNAELLEMLPKVVGPQKQAIERMLALRAKLEKQIKHAELMDLERGIALQIIAKRLGEDEMQNFYQELNLDRALGLSAAI